VHDQDRHAAPSGLRPQRWPSPQRCTPCTFHADPVREPTETPHRSAGCPSLRHGSRWWKACAWRWSPSAGSSVDDLVPMRWGFLLSDWALRFVSRAIFCKVPSSVRSGIADGSTCRPTTTMEPAGCRLLMDTRKSRLGRALSDWRSPTSRTPLPVCPRETTTGAGFWTEYPSVPPRYGKSTVFPGRRVS
jgi:hypothetical protein